MSIRAIFFDIGDTLVFDRPSLSERFWRAAEMCAIQHDPDLRDAGFRLAEAHAVQRYIRGIDWEDPVVAMECTARAVKGAGGPVLTISQSREVARAFGRLGAERELHKGALPLLDTLRARGFHLGVISDWDQTLVGLLEGWGIHCRVDTLAISSECGATKPSKTIFQAALDRSGIPPEESLHVGDYYELDIAGAQSVGMNALLYDWRNRSPNAKCARVRSFEELAEYLFKLSNPI